MVRHQTEIQQLLSPAIQTICLELANNLSTEPKEIIISFGETHECICRHRRTSIGKNNN